MVLRRVLFLLLSGTAFAQPTAETCRERCVSAMMECLNPCANSNAKNAGGNLECIRECRQKHQPCLKACD